jgi:transposase
LGVDMSRFPTAKHAASWAGLVPGMNESAGKRHGGRTRHGNRWIRRGLCQSAWVVSRMKGCYLTAVFRRRMRAGGKKKAVVATAHQILVIAYAPKKKRGRPRKTPLAPELNDGSIGT